MATGLYIEIQLLCSALFLILLYKVITGQDRSIRQLYFCALLISCITTFLLDAAQACFSGSSLPSDISASYIFNTLYYGSLAANGYIWFLYAEIEQDSRLVRTRKTRLICAIPCFLLVVLAFSSPFTHVLFYIDDAGLYQRGPLHFVQLIISYSYLIFPGVQSYLGSLKSRNYDEHRRLLINSSYLIPTIVAGILQIAMSDLPTICAGATVSLFFIYISIQEDFVFIDPLTQVNNRRRLMRLLNARFNHAREDGRAFGLIMLDLNQFKSINDVYGHIEGDNALIHVGCALRSLTGSGVRPFRYGGDEFVVLTEATSPEDMTQIAQNIQVALETESEAMKAPYTLSASIGWAVWTPATASPQDLIDRADARLYENKIATAVARKVAHGNLGSTGSLGTVQSINATCTSRQSAPGTTGAMAALSAAAPRATTVPGAGAPVGSTKASTNPQGPSKTGTNETNNSGGVGA